MYLIWTADLQIPFQSDMHLHQNNEKIVVILTRNPGYRKKSMTKGMAKLYRRAYGKYPEAVKTMIRRNLYV